MTKLITENELSLLINQLNATSNENNLAPAEALHDAEAGLSSSSTQDGWVQVIDHNKIIIHNPGLGGKQAVIHPVHPVRLIVNDLEIMQQTSVSSTDYIRWEIADAPLFDIHVSEDRLSAMFHLHARERYAWQLVNTAPGSEVLIRAEEDKRVLLKTVQIGDVLVQLKRLNIHSNLNLSAIQQELTSPTHQQIEVAKGKAPIEGQDAKLDIFFSQQVENQFYEVGGTVDFRNHLQIPSVNRGDIIAKKTLLIDGVPGYDVFGNVLIPPTPKDILVVAKANVELTPDGDIIAIKEGRPRITGNKMKVFDISTAYIIPGNVDIETGNIVFSGDVIVYGHVTDKMIIESLGNVYVYGNVYNSTITATGSIHVRGNVMGSKLYSGYFGVMFNRLYSVAKTLSEQIEKLADASRIIVQTLEARKQPVRYGQIVVLLMETKIKEIPSSIRELWTVLASVKIPQDEQQKLREMSDYFMQTARLAEHAAYSSIQGYLAILQDMHKEVARMQEEKVAVNINQCHNSEIKSNGDVIIHRDGVLLSDLYSAGNIYFKHDSAICRGSQLEAGISIYAKTIGGQTGASTTLKAGQFIDVVKMYSGRICIDKHCIDIFELIENRRFDRVYASKSGE